MNVTGTQKVTMGITDETAKHITTQYLRQLIGLTESGWVDTSPKKPQVIKEMIDVGCHKSEMERKGVWPATADDLIWWAALQALRHVDCRKEKS